MKKVVNLSVSFDRGLETYPKMSIDEAIETLTDYGTKYAVVEKPIIPKFVAEWYEIEGKYSSWWNFFYKWGRDESRSDLETKTIKWMQDYNEEKFVDMFLHGYTVEEEQKYRVIDRHKVYLLAKEEERNKVETVAKLVEFYGHEHVELNYHLTEQEIKDYDERYMNFAVKVEETEE